MKTSQTEQAESQELLPTVNPCYDAGRGCQEDTEEENKGNGYFDGIDQRSTPENGSASLIASCPEGIQRGY